jgi:ABC transporter substrate binding protein
MNSSRNAALASAKSDALVMPAVHTVSSSSDGPRESMVFCRDLAAELVRLKVDVLITHGTPGTFAAKHATTTAPIVMAVNGDALITGIVSNLARPGGNIARAPSVGIRLRRRDQRAYNNGCSRVRAGDDRQIMLAFRH